MRILALDEDLAVTVRATHGMIPMILLRMLPLLLQHLLLLVQLLQLLIDPPLADAAASAGLAPAAGREDQRQRARVHLVGDTDLLFLHILDLAVGATPASLAPMAGFGLAAGLALDDDAFLVGRAGAGPAPLLFLDGRVGATLWGAAAAATVVGGVVAGFVDGEVLGFVLGLGPTAAVFALASGMAFAAAAVVGFGSGVAGAACVATTAYMATTAQGAAHLVPFADGAGDLGCVLVDDDFSALDDSFSTIGRWWWSFDGVGDAF